MKKFRCIVIAFGTLEKISAVFIQSTDVDAARRAGIARFLNKENNRKFFIGAEPC